jgi:hypothetical protein
VSSISLLLDNAVLSIYSATNYQYSSVPPVFLFLSHRHSQVKVYGKDADKFDKDFAAVFQKLEELGTSGLTPTEWA